MNDFQLLAMTVPDAVVWGAIVSIVTTIAGGLKVVWAYWTRREGDRIARYKVVIETKEKLITEKDLEIKNLGIKLSKKSDDHAQKVEQLMNLTLTKVEEMGERHLDMGEKALRVMAEFTATVKMLNLEGQ